MMQDITKPKTIMTPLSLQLDNLKLPEQIVTARK